MHEINGRFLAALFALNTWKLVTDAVVAQSKRDLFRHQLKNGCRFLPEVISQIECLKAIADEIPWIKEPINPVYNIHHCFFGWDGLGTDVIETQAVGAGFDQLVHNTGYFFPKMTLSLDGGFALIENEG